MIGEARGSKKGPPSKADFAISLLAVLLEKGGGEGKNEEYYFWPKPARRNNDISRMKGVLLVRPPPFHPAWCKGEADFNGEMEGPPKNFLISHLHRHFQVQKRVEKGRKKRLSADKCGKS